MPGHDFTTGEVLTAANVDAYLNNSIYCQARQTVSQNLLDSTMTALTFTTEDFDTDSIHDTGSNTSRFVCQTAGVYMLSGGMGIAANLTGQRYVQWAKNGTAINGSATRATGAANTNAVAPRTIFVTLAVSDYIELNGHQNSTGTLATNATTDMQSHVTFWRVSS